MPTKRFVLLLCASSLLCAQDKPHSIAGGFALPNGWRVTPLGKSIPTEDLVLDTLPSPDGRVVISLNAGYNQHGLMVVDTRTEEAVQRIPLETAWHGMAWSPEGRKLYVSGGNATGKRTHYSAPIHVFEYRDGRLSDKPVGKLEETLAMTDLYWSGMVHHPHKNLLYAANLGTGSIRGSITVFDTSSGKMLERVGVDMNPYDLVLNPDGSRLYVSNWASESVSVIDTESMKLVGTVAVGPNPNAMILGPDGRLYVSCANDNSVAVVDTRSAASWSGSRRRLRRGRPKAPRPTRWRLTPRTTGFWSPMPTTTTSP